MLPEKTALAVVLCMVGQAFTTTLIRRNLTGFDLARCNDGSPAAYFYDQDLRFSDGNVMIYLPDGGHCSTVETCRSRCRQASAAQSKCTAPSEQVLERTDGIWSSNPLINPFSDHFKVLLHYCSSDNYAGTRGSSKITGNLYFHGKHILTAMLEDLAQRFGLERAKSVTLVGTGSGARGVGYNCDYIASLLPGVRVRCIADSPDMVPYWVKTETCGKRDYEKEEGEKILWGREEDQSCIEENKAEVNSSELAHRCGVWSRYWPHIDTPFFIVGSQFDPTSFAESPCVPDISSPEYEEFELAWRRGVSALYEGIRARKRDRGWFVPDCRAHGYLGAQADTRLAKLKVPSLDSNKTLSMSESLQQWMKDESASLHAMDVVASGNLGCPGPAPLCRSVSACGVPRPHADYPTVRRRLLPPSSLFPKGYERRCCLDPWQGSDYDGASDSLPARGYGLGAVNFPRAGADKRSSLYKRLIYLQYLRSLYNRHKTEYAREYYGYDGGYEVDSVHHGSRIPDLGLGQQDTRVRGGVKSRLPDLTSLLGEDYYDYAYDDYGSGLVARIINATRLKKGKNKNVDAKVEAEVDDFEDFGASIGTDNIETSTK